MGYGDYLYGDTTLPTIPSLRRGRSVYGGFKRGQRGEDIGLMDFFTPEGTGKIVGKVAKSFGIGGSGGGGEEGKRISAVMGQLFGQIGKATKGLDDFTPRGSGRRSLYKFGEALTNLRSAGEGLHTAASKPHAWSLISKAQGALSEFGKAGKEVAGRGGGGAPRGAAPAAGARLKIPLQKGGAAFPGAEAPGGGSLLGPMIPLQPVSYTARRASVKPPVYRGSPGTEKPKFAKNPLEAEFDELGRLLS